MASFANFCLPDQGLAQHMEPTSFYKFDPSGRHAASTVTDKNLKNSRIPWLERPGNRFAETEMSKTILASDSLKDPLAKRNCFDLLNEIFPRYLPARYHAMECSKLASNKHEGYFWDNAALFLFCNQVLGPSYYRDITIGLQKSRDPASHVFRHFQATTEWQYIAEEHIDECKTAKEFLLEPWVLLQLPFQPVLFYQWTVAVLAEALRLQRELVDFYTMDIPRHFGDAVAKLFSINVQLLQFSHDSLIFFSELSRKKANRHFHQPNKQFIQDCDKILPAVKFVLGDECKNIIKALKRLCWNAARKDQTNEADKIRTVVDGLSFERFDVFLNRWFWESFEWREFLVKGQLRPEDEESPSRLAEKFSTSLLSDKKAPAEALLKLVAEKILEPGRLKGVPRDKILEAVSDMGDKLNCFYDLHLKYSGTSTEKGSSKSREGGVILDIINLHSDVKVAEAVSLMTQYISQHVSIASGPGVYIAAVDCKGPEMSYESIVESLGKIQPSKAWCFETILSRVKATLPKRKDKLQINLGADKIVHHLEGRIKSLVVSMITRQFKSLRGDFEYHFEQQLVQYILPCLVASILLVEKYYGHKEYFKNFVALVEALVSAYEKEQYVLTSPWEWSRCPYLAFRETYIMYYKMVDVDCKDAVLERFGDGSPVLKAVLHHIFKHDDRLAEVRPMDEFNAHLDVLLAQHFLLVCRLQSAMQTLGWTQNPYINLGHVLYFSFADKRLFDQITMDMLFIYRSYASLKTKHSSELVKRAWRSDLEHISLALVEAAEELSLQQILALLVFYLVRFRRDGDRDPQRCVLDHMPFDDLGEMFASVRNQDWWKLKQLLAPLLRGDDCTDSSEISLAEAEANACFAEALKKLTPKGKVAMKEPGETTFFPVRHCRWCGVTAAENFRLCPECKSEPRYFDFHFFCSENCETVCLEMKHSEEHARFNKK